MSHSGLMRYLGDVDTCHLVTGDDIPNVVVARDGGNALDALLYDLTNSFVPLFRDRLDDFHNAMRQGSRSYDIAKSGGPRHITWFLRKGRSHFEDRSAMNVKRLR